ncbi:MAG: preprotein translocase subunit SecE [Deferribacterota bacterium]|nr:preprotein translocase subunit SecE [Deferribacterota bacterium]
MILELKRFLRQVKEELKKVIWPTRELTIGTTFVVLLLVFIVSIFLGVVDIALSKIIRFIIG